MNSARKLLWIANSLAHKRVSSKFEWWTLFGTLWLVYVESKCRPRERERRWNSRRASNVHRSISQRESILREGKTFRSKKKERNIPGYILQNCSLLFIIIFVIRVRLHDFGFGWCMHFPIFTESNICISEARKKLQTLIIENYKGLNAG